MTNGQDSVDPVGGPGTASSSPSRPPTPTGLVLSPLRAWRYDPAVAGDLQALTSPPYDVLDADGVTALEAASEHNIVRLILPRDSAPGVDDRYARAAALLEQWREDGVLRPDAQPALYVYEQADPATGHTQRGLLGLLSLTPAQDRIVLPHENTMAGPVADRLALYTATHADLEPIFLLYDGGGAATRAVAAADQEPPLVDAELPDGLRHRLWALTDPGLLAEVAADLHPRRAVIADGHHRYATYLQRQADQHAAGRGPGPWDGGLAFLVDASSFGPQVHPIHRVLPGRSAAELAARAAPLMTVRELTGVPVEEALAVLTQAEGDGAAFVLADGDPTAPRMWLLSHPDPEQLAAALPTQRSAAWRSLDIAVLHSALIVGRWQISDDVEAVRYEHDVPTALAAAAAATGTAVLLNPTPVGAVTAVAAAGERMPRKSTLFTPKPRTGLVLRHYRDA